jgi:short-subunit dehydrogenase
VSRRRVGPYRFAGGTALVTGAAGGIGAALAAGLAARGSHLVLLDRDAEALGAGAGALRVAHPSLRIATHVVDLADDAATVRAGAELARAHPETTLVIHNAGVALAGRFDQVDAGQFDTVLAVNLRAVVTLTRALLPVLTAHRGAHLVALSSVFGIVAPHGQTAYCTSKFAVRGFMESLRGELAPAGVGVTVVHPGGVRTGIARNAIIGSGLPAADWTAGLARFEQFLSRDPAAAAETILRGVHRRRRRVLVGRDAKAVDALARLLPSTHTRLLAAGTHRLTTRR